MSSIRFDSLDSFHRVGFPSQLTYIPYLPTLPTYQCSLSLSFFSLLFNLKFSHPDFFPASFLDLYLPTYLTWLFSLSIFFISHVFWRVGERETGEGEGVAVGFLSFLFHLFPRATLRTGADVRRSRRGGVEVGVGFRFHFSVWSFVALVFFLSFSTYMYACIHSFSPHPFSTLFIPIWFILPASLSSLSPLRSSRPPALICPYPHPPVKTKWLVS